MNSMFSARFLASCDDICMYWRMDKIGEGTFGKVYKAEHKLNKNLVAVKKLLKLDEPSTAFSANREIRLLKKIQHKNIIKLISVCKLEGFDTLDVYTVFPFCEHDLAGLIKSDKITLNISVIKNIMFQLLIGVSYIHSNNIMHRDLKPSNIFLTQDGVLKIGDFGIACNFWSDGYDKYTNLVTSLWYRSPELLLGSRQYGPSVDMWSVGCIFVELCTRQKAFLGKNAQDQLVLISQLCGSICPETWPGVDKLKKYYDFDLPQDLNRNLKQEMKDSLSDVFGLYLLDKLLMLNPKLRITAKSALCNAFFLMKPDQTDLSEILCGHTESFFDYFTRVNSDGSQEKIFLQNKRREFY